MNIWRLGQVHSSEDLKLFYKNNKLSFNWLQASIDYMQEDIRKQDGWTSVLPWVYEVKKDDIIFLWSKYYYGGFAIVLDGYKYNNYDFDNYPRPLPGLPVKFLHKLKSPIEHGSIISHNNPRTFSRVNQYGFNLISIIDFLKKNFRKEYDVIVDYINKSENTQNKISRVCWNTHDYKKPSGSAGKNLSEDSFEGKYGFGFEEWLNVKDRIIDGYHYSFLQPLSAAKYYDYIYNISLIVSGVTGNWYHIGRIKNAICISPQESEKIYDIYKNNGWIEEMSKEIDSIGGKSNEFRNQPPSNLFNLKFHPDNLEIKPDFEEIINTEISTHRYKLLDGSIQEQYVSDDQDEEDDDGNLRSTKKVKKVINNTIIYDALHSKIQNALYKKLKKDKNLERVLIEKGRVDLKAKTKEGKWLYFEIKTYGSCKKSIRNAIGQIMEYAYWPSKQKADELIIISDNAADIETKTYMQHIRKKFNLPIYYQSFKLPNLLGKKI